MLLRQSCQAGVEASLNARNTDAQDNIHDETRSPIDSEDIDPEDRIFDSLSTSESDVDSDSEEPHDNITAAQHLLRDLQQNIEDIRTNVIQLTQRLPRHRASSQVSTISSQLNSITRSLGTIHQHHTSGTQRLATARAMDRPHLRTSLSEDLSDEGLIERVSQLSIQTTQLLSTPDGRIRNYRLARTANDLDQVLADCDHRGTPAPVGPVFGSHLPPANGSLLEYAISLRNSIIGPQTYSTHYASSSIASSDGPPSSEQHVQATRAPAPQRGGIWSPPAVSAYQPTGYLGQLSRSERNSSEHPAPPRNLYHRDTSITSDPTQQHENSSRILPRSSSGSTSYVSSSGLPPADWRLTGETLASLENFDQYAQYLGAVEPYFNSQQTHPQAEPGRSVSAELGQSSTRRQSRTSSLPGRSTVGSQQSTHDRFPFTHAPRRRLPLSPSNEETSGYSHPIEEHVGVHWSETQGMRLPPRAGLDGGGTAPASDEFLFAHRIPVSSQWDHYRLMYPPARPNQEQRPRRQRPREPAPSLDNDPTRPAPVAEEAKSFKMECKICLNQISNQVLLPC
ncbi:MAG: hypothetical protein Q9168_007119, partial [Polycauliona sp. 1 TL-2023]